MTRRPRALLFDVDGTLLDSGGAGRLAFVAAWEDVFGPGDPFVGVSFAGRTDPGIVAECAEAHLGRAPEPPEIEAFFARYLERLPGEVAAAPRYRVLPGVPALLQGLSERPDVLLGLCTGNLEGGARIKLARGGLDRFFPFGGFASDHGDRAALTRQALDRARERAGRPVDALVVGDSPLDARAARANGLPIALVATGWTAPEDLRAEAPDLYFESFQDHEAAIARLLGLGENLRAGTADVDRATTVMRDGGVLLYPTSTLYGIGGDALDPAVASRVRGLKGQRDAPFIVLAAGVESAFALARDPAGAARELAARFWPVPLTLVLPAADAIPREVVGADGTVAVRVDPHPFARDLCAAAGRPLISTSANRTGAPPPRTAADMDPALVAACDLFVQDEHPLGGTPSTVVRVTTAGIEILRAGAVPAEALGVVL